jgi:hypothetical protein
MMKGQRRGGLEFLDPPPGLQLWEQPAVLSGNVRYPSIHRNPRRTDCPPRFARASDPQSAVEHCTRRREHASDRSLSAPQRRLETQAKYARPPRGFGPSPAAPMRTSRARRLAHDTGSLGYTVYRGPEFRSRLQVAR